MATKVKSSMQWPEEKTPEEVTAGLLSWGYAEFFLACEIWWLTDFVRMNRFPDRLYLLHAVAKINYSTITINIRELQHATS